MHILNIQLDNFVKKIFQPLLFVVRPTPEEGWLQGTLNGKTGIIPMNHVEFIDWSKPFDYTNLEDIKSGLRSLWLSKRQDMKKAGCP